MKLLINPRMHVVQNEGRVSHRTESCRNPDERRLTAKEKSFHTLTHASATALVQRGHELDCDHFHFTVGLQSADTGGNRPGAAFPEVH